MTSRSRRQTRQRRMDTPWDRQPWNHNETVAIVRQIRQMSNSARIARRSFTRLADAVNRVGAALHAYNQREK